MTGVDLIHVPSTDGVTVAIYDFGGSGPELLFCHATGFCGMVWQPLAEALRHRFHCYALDFRAHGRSSRPDGDNMVWSGMANDILAVVKAISPNRPIRAVGHSLGGGSMVLAEAKSPGTFQSCWAFEPILFALPSPEEERDAPHRSEMSEGARRRRDHFASRDEVYERYRNRPPLDSLDDRCLRAYIEHGFRDRDDGTVELCCSPENEARTFEQHRTGADTVLGELTVPYGLAIGAEVGGPVDAIIDLTRRFPEVDVIRYLDLNHFGPLQQPERVATDIAAWFGATGDSRI